MTLFAGAMGCTPIALAQSPSTESKAEEVRTFFLTNLTEGNEALDIQTDLRNMLPNAHMYFLESQGAITISAKPDQVAQAEKMIAEFDRKRKIYKITYAITVMENGKASGTRHVTLIIPTHGKTVLKEGTRVPIVTGSTDQESGKPSSQVQYVDIGLNIDAALEGTGDALRLRTKVEESGVADEKSGIAQDPIIQQTTLEGIAMLGQNRPTLLGSLDLPGGTRHEEISVESELVR